MQAEQWLKQQKQQAGRSVTVTTVLGILSGAFVILQALALATIADRVIFEDAGLAALTPWILALAGAFLARALLAWATERSAYRSAHAVRSAARSELFSHLRSLGPVGIRSTRTGEAVSAVVESVEALDPYFARYLPQRAIAAVVPLAILVLVFPFDWISGLILTATAFFVPVSMILIGKGAEELNRKQWRKLTIMGGRFLDLIQGLPTTKLLGAGGREARAIETMAEDHRQTTMQVLKVAFLSAFMLELLSTISIATVAVSIGLRLLDTAIPFHAGYFILLLAPEFYAPLKNLGTQYHARMEAIGAAEQIRQFLSQEPLPRGARGDGAIELSGGPALQLSELRFTYPEADRPALDGVSLRVSAGSHVALVGPSGAGKSTLTAMIMGFLEPDHGSVSVEGTDLCTLDPEAWLRQVAWIPQHPHVFKGSIRDNIRLGMPGAEHARVEEAARSAHAHEFIAELADGYDTEVGERGHTLSGGQIQRIALARAFLQDAPLIVLDEPSAHLDLYSERVIGESLERLMRGKTCVSIAHRLSTVRRADRIVVLDAGRVVEEGDHEELLRRGGHYARVVQGSRSAGRAGSAAEQEGGR